MGKFVKLLIGNFLIINLSIVFAIGYQTTAGYTTYDWLFSGPLRTWCRTDSVGNGVHIAWTWSNFAPAVDRNIRYNFFDFVTHNWLWDGGINVFSFRSGGLGALDYDPIIGGYVISSTQSSGGQITPVVAKDQGYCLGPAGFSSPAISVSANQSVHCVMIATYDSLWYSRIQPWPNWTTPIYIGCPGQTVSSYNIAASKISNKVIVTWTEYDELSTNTFGYYRLSNDGGLTWGQPTQIPFPPNSISFNDYSFYTMFDHNDDFHFVCAVCDTNNVYNCGIWHYCLANNPPWSLVFGYHPDTLAAGIGYNAIGACRPTIVENLHDHYLYVAWEQFDSLNYEPLTSLSRADVWIAESPDNGLTWQNQQPITSPNTTSKRFPCAGGVDHDTLSVAYLIDSIAGFEICAQGRTTRNPVVLHRLKVPLPTIEIIENSIWHIQHLTLDATPNPFTSHTAIRYSLPIESNVSLLIYDASGRLVKTFNAISGSRSAKSEVIWDGKDNNGIEVKSGVYFYTLKTADKSVTRKIIKAE